MSVNAFFLSPWLMEGRTLKSPAAGSATLRLAALSLQSLVHSPPLSAWKRGQVLWFWNSHQVLQSSLTSGSFSCPAPWPCPTHNQQDAAPLLLPHLSCSHSTQGLPAQFHCSMGSLGSVASSTQRFLSLPSTQLQGLGQRAFVPLVRFVVSGHCLWILAAKP